jgi:hypothetical protein
MPIIVYKGERKLSDLVGRVYGTDLKAVDAKRAEQALLAANPQLATLRDVREGAMLAVPQVPGVAAARSDAPDAQQAAIATGKDDLDAYRRRLGTRLDEDRQTIDATAELLKSKEAKALAKAAPESAAYFERATAALKARQADADARAAAIKALAKLRADFDELAKKLG